MVIGGANLPKKRPVSIAGYCGAAARVCFAIFFSGSNRTGQLFDSGGSRFPELAGVANGIGS